MTELRWLTYLEKNKAVFSHFFSSYRNSLSLMYKIINAIIFLAKVSFCDEKIFSLKSACIYFVQFSSFQLAKFL